MLLIFLRLENFYHLSIKKLEIFSKINPKRTRRNCQKMFSIKILNSHVLKVYSFCLAMIVQNYCYDHTIQICIFFVTLFEFRVLKILRLMADLIIKSLNLSLF